MSDKTVLVLRTCNAQMQSYGGFKWPESGPVAAPYWSPKPECGHGLHGLLRGAGDSNMLDFSAEAKWLVCEANEKEIVDLGGKVKFPRATVLYAGDRETATNIIADRYPDSPVHFAVRTVGDYGHATVGDYGHATAGDRGHATAGVGGHATVGDHGRAVAGYRGIAEAGDYGYAFACGRGRAIAGDHGRATAGYDGRAEAGDYGHATVGDGGRATVGIGGRATAGIGGSAAAGDRGVISIDYHDVGGRIRIATAYVGEDGIEPDVPYVLDDQHKFVKKP